MSESPVSRPKAPLDVTFKVEDGADASWLKKVEISLERVSPDRAEKYLSTNVGNRSISKTNIARYATDIANGEWDPRTFEGVKFDTEGNLIDGQNRLQAIIEADTPQEIIVFRGLPRDTRLKLDQGKSRSTSNYMQIEGIENASTKAAITRAIIHVDEWQQRTGLNAFDQAARFVTNTEALRRYKHDAATRESIEYALTYYKNFPGMSRAVLGALYYNLHKYGNPTIADRFLTELRLANGKPGSPAMVLRERLLTAQHGPKQSRLHRNEAMALTIHAYNRYAQNKSWQRAKLPSRYPRISSRVSPELLG